MSVAIPGSIDDVNADWLAEATGLDIKTADIGIIGVGVGVASAVYRAKLTGNNCPASVIVKLPALDEAAVFTSTILRMYIREVRFFKSLAKECPVITLTLTMRRQRRDKSICDGARRSRRPSNNRPDGWHND